ncbi:MAG TPA: ester cyclase [candidate division Zixibacteria bacterium]|nr:ester cyclase [candidate division Zixibacteria bacterium]
MYSQKIPAVLMLAVLIIAITAGCAQEPKPLISEAEVAEIVKTYEEARNSYNLDLLDKIFSPDVVVHDPGAPETIVGLSALKEYYHGSHAGIPDLKLTLDEYYISGDRIFWIWTFSGTHTDTLRGLPPTASVVNFKGVAIDRIANGMIVEEWVYYDMLSLMKQLGFTLVPPKIEGEK